MSLLKRPIALALLPLTLLLLHLSLTHRAFLSFSRSLDRLTGVGDVQVHPADFVQLASPSPRSLSPKSENRRHATFSFEEEEVTVNSTNGVNGRHSIKRRVDLRVEGGEIAVSRDSNGGAVSPASPLGTAADRGAVPRQDAPLAAPDPLLRRTARTPTSPTHSSSGGRRSVDPVQRLSRGSDMSVGKGGATLLSSRVSTPPPVAEEISDDEEEDEADEIVADAAEEDGPSSPCIVTRLSSGSIAPRRRRSSSLDMTAVIEAAKAKDQLEIGEIGEIGDGSASLPLLLAASTPDLRDIARHEIGISLAAPSRFKRSHTMKPGERSPHAARLGSAFTLGRNRSMQVRRSIEWTREWERQWLVL